MPVDNIRYDLLTQDALRGVIRTVLTNAATKGLPGDHHFFITFDTRAEGVRMSPRLKASYPEEMTIVLQHQFWDLTVAEEDFEVGLAFNGIRERLHVPLKAVKAFLDPSVQFGLQFTVEPEAGAAKAEAPAVAAVARPRTQEAQVGTQAGTHAGAGPQAGPEAGTQARAKQEPKSSGPQEAPAPPREKRATRHLPRRAKWCGSIASARNSRAGRLSAVSGRHGGWMLWTAPPPARQAPSMWVLLGHS